MEGRKLLYLIRHAQAERARAGVGDADRTLTREGREDTVLAARGLKRLGVKLDVVLTSPLRRAQETARLLALGLQVDVVRHDALAPGSPPDELLLSLAEFSNAASLALVGHEPDMGRLASVLLVGDPLRIEMPFKPGQVAAVEVGAIPPRCPGLLRWFATQQQLSFIGS
ncbi:MAG: phosphohistidine phosphatase SixA [Candidatus Binatia bacterium]|nr:phosphohistidine phosphatase SixA [Candidatus Binatia bacterium]